MKRKMLPLLVLVTVMLGVVACTPETSPGLASPQIASQPTPIVLSPSSPAVSAKESTWAKVVEAARKEGSVLFFAEISFAGDKGTALIEPFRRSTGINLEIIVGRSAGMYERIKTEKRTGQIVTDVIDMPPTTLKSMTSEGLVAAVLDLPVFQDRGAWLVDPLEYDPQAQMIPYESVWVSPYVNTKLVKETEWPTSLQDFLKPQWKGKMVASDPRTGSGAYRYYVPLVRLGIIDWQYVKTLWGQDLMLAPNNSASIMQVASGAVSLAPFNSSGSSLPTVLAGAPVKAISMKEGDLFDVNTFGAVAGSPHPNAAKVFMNWFLSAEGQRVYTNVAKNFSPRKDILSGGPKDVIPPNPSVRKIPITNVDTAEASRLLIDSFIPKLVGLNR